jgi:branched-subunit amino acid aminotransferase/4-amino-4-deoxychorismate lyase
VNEAPSCYSSARARGGQVWHAARHAARLARDARLLGLGDVDEAAVLALLRDLARPTRDGPDLKIRVEAQADARLGVQLGATTSPIGIETSAWRCATATVIHPGASPISSAKRSERSLYEAALASASEPSIDELLLFDAVDRLVEGTRTNLIVVRRDGSLVTPPLACGPQAGVARGLLIERVPLLGEAEISRDDVAAAREILATNAVRGVLPVIEWDGRPVGAGEPGPWGARLAAALQDD